MRSFIVRLWHPLGPADPAHGLRGTVEHVGSGRSATFADGAGLIEFLQRILESTAEAASADRSEPEEAP